MKWIFVLAISLPPILVIFSYLMKTVPNYSETRIIHGLYGEVIIDRSDKGIPEIKASCIEDVFFALGYIHAMDRL